MARSSPITTGIEVRRGRSAGVKRQRVAAQFFVASEQHGAKMLGNGEQQLIEWIVVSGGDFETSGRLLPGQRLNNQTKPLDRLKQSLRIMRAFTIA